MSGNRLRPVLLAASGVAALSLFGSIGFAAAPARLAGAISGLVTDGSGTPQMGAAVFLLNPQERIFGRVLTDEKGAFAFAGLAPGFYAVRVTLSSFLPVVRENILVQPGGRSLLNVSLAGLLSSIELVYPGPDHRAIMTDDWKWVLRTSTATRPVLRFGPGWRIDAPGARNQNTSVFSDTRGLVRVSAGDGGDFTGSDGDLGTAFALATSVFGANQVQVSGNVGYGAQSRVPSTSFRTSYRREIGGAAPELSVTMRQLYAPFRVADSLGGGNSGLPSLRSLSFSLRDKTQIGDALLFEYGISMDSVTFFDRLNYASPFGRLTYTLAPNSAVQFTYMSGLPRPEFESGLTGEISSLSQLPRVSLRGGRAKVQRAENFELAWHGTYGSRSYRVAASRENVSNAALMLFTPDGAGSQNDILPDLFSGNSIYNAGDYGSLGASVSVTQHLGENLNVTAVYSTAAALAASSGGTPDDLRSMITASRRQALTARVSGISPWTGTHFAASYQLADGRAVTPSLLYSVQRARAEAGLNFHVRQPIPSFSFVPVRMEATADLRNLLAQGYLPLTTFDGRRYLLMQTPRSVRGGLSFIF
ncbi:MAG: TonB-dependent receptor [Bryobacterales bacterium]|nr:TonB-dependent receptor [Bryobacterales bacterium]